MNQIYTNTLVWEALIYTTATQPSEEYVFNQTLTLRTINACSLTQVSAEMGLMERSERQKG